VAKKAASAVLTSSSLPDHLLLNKKEVARVLRVTERTLVKWYETGVFPRPIQPGHRGSLRWSRATVQKWIEEGGVAR
jgi:predicted DNA-binding transcriptional regulator AlpA